MLERLCMGGVVAVLAAGTPTVSAGIGPAVLDFRLRTTGDVPSTEPLVIYATGHTSLNIELMAQARVSGDPAARGVAVFFGLLNASEGPITAFAPALLSADEAFGLPPGTLSVPDPEGRTGVVPPYRAVLGGSAGNSDPSNGRVISEGWDFLPQNLAQGGVPDPLADWDDIYKFTWSTSDTSPRTVEITLSSRELGGAYHSWTTGLEYLAPAEPVTFTIIIVPTPGAAGALLAPLLVFGRRRR